MSSRNSVVHSLVLLLLVISIFNAQAQDEIIISDFEAGIEDWAISSGNDGSMLIEHAPGGKDCGGWADLLVDFKGQGVLGEAGIFWRPAGGSIDFSDGEELLVDIYAPNWTLDDSVSVLVQSYVKSGPNYTYENVERRLIPNKWNTISMPIDSISVPSDIKEIGIKLLTTTLTLQGNFLIDNFRLIDGNDISLPQYDLDFNDNLQGFEREYDWVSGTALNYVPRSTLDCYTLQVSRQFVGNKVWDAFSVSTQIFPVSNFSAQQDYALAVDILTPDDAENAAGQLGIRFLGQQLQFQETQLLPGNWTTLLFPLREASNANEISYVEVKIAEVRTEPAYQTFLIDNVRLVSMNPTPNSSEEPTITPQATPPTQVPTSTPTPQTIELTQSLPLAEERSWKFDLDNEGWYQNPDNGFVADRDIDHGRAPDGQGALIIRTHYSGNSFEDAGASLVLDNGNCVNLTEYTHYAIDFNLPQVFEEGGGRLWLKYTPPEWYFAESKFIKVSSTANVTWVVPLVDMQSLSGNPSVDLSCILEIGFKLGNQKSYVGDFYVTEVRLMQLPASLSFTPLGTAGVQSINVRSCANTRCQIVDTIALDQTRVAFYRNEACTWLRIDQNVEQWVSLDVIDYRGNPCTILPVAKDS